MNNFASRRDCRNKSFEVSERTLPANVIVGRNLADCTELVDPCEDFPDLRSEDITAVELPTAQITNIFQKLNDTLQSLREHTVKTLSLKSIAQDACVNARAYDYERMYYDEANRAKDLELELRVVREGYENLSKEKEIMQKNYEEFITNLQTENKVLKALEIRVSQLDSQKRKTEEDIQRLMFENKLLKEQEHTGSRALLEELKAKIKKYNDEKMEYLNRLEEHQSEVSELTHQLETARQAQLADKQNYQRVIENFRLENESLKSQLEKVRIDKETTTSIESSEKDKQIEFIKKEIEILKLQVVNSSFESTRNSQGLRSPNDQTGVLNPDYKASITADRINAFANPEMNPEMTSMRDTGLMSGKQSTSFAQMPSSNVVSTRTIDFANYRPEERGQFSIKTKNDGVKVSKTLEQPSYEARLQAVPQNRDFSKSPNISTTRRIIRLGDADNPFTRGLSKPQVTSIMGNNEQVSHSIPSAKINFNPPKAPDADQTINFMLPDTVSMADSGHLGDNEEIFLRKARNQTDAASQKKSNDTTLSENQSIGKDSLDINPNLLTANKRDDSLNASINHHQGDDSVLTSESRIQEVFDELNG